LQFAHFDDFLIFGQLLNVSPCGQWLYVSTIFL
jgi:hypothetical protein